jgi:hypothetical protein
LPSPTPTPRPSPPPSSAAAGALEHIGRCISPRERQLADTVNAYRVGRGLGRVNLSRSLLKVARYHVWDLEANKPSAAAECNLHSWSAASSLWSPVCYTRGHANAAGMWAKGCEIAQYDSNTFEIAYYRSAGATAAAALAGWTASAAHLDVILERGRYWSGRKWPAMGVGINERYAVVWFGSLADPAGPVSPC